MMRLLLAFTLVMTPVLTRAGETPQLSPGTGMQQAGMVDIRNLVPDMSQSIAYAGNDNFIGEPIDGYQAPRCWLNRESAEARARTDAALRTNHMRLRVFDCYRPAR